MAVLLPMKVAAIFSLVGGMSQTAVLMLFGIHSAKEEQFLFCTWWWLIFDDHDDDNDTNDDDDDNDNKDDLLHLQHSLVHLLDWHPAPKHHSNCKIPDR